MLKFCGDVHLKQELAVWWIHRETAKKFEKNSWI